MSTQYYETDPSGIKNKVPPEVEAETQQMLDELEQEGYLTWNQQSPHSLPQNYQCDTLRGWEMFGEQK